MAEKKTYNNVEKQEVLQDFGEILNDQSLRILEYFRKSGKDVNKLLKTAYKYRELC